MVAPDPAASRKRKVAPSANECASKKPKYVKEVLGQSLAKLIAAKPDCEKEILLELRLPAPKLPN